MLIRRSMLSALVIPILFAAMPILAQTARPPSANAQQMQQLQQLASERTALQAENSRIKADLEQARKERDSLKAAQQSLVQRGKGAEAQLAAAQGDRARLEGDLARERKRLEELTQRFREMAASVRDVETDRSAKTQQLLQREQDLRACVDRNAKLYTLNQEVLARFEDQGFWSSMAGREPFTRIKRNQLENLADDYRGRADENRISAPASSAK